MDAPIHREQAAQYRRRWEVVAQVERAELQATSLEDKLRQTAALMASAAPMGWTEALAAEEAKVRERWMRLREVYRGRE